jgi:hypothetical protein
MKRQLHDKTVTGAGIKMNESEEIGAGVSIFVPPYGLILAHLAAGTQDRDDVVVPQKLLRFLLRCLLDRTDFDEEQYQVCNPDVAEAIRQKAITSGREHFINVGYFEGRTGGTAVLETWYLARNPDVAAAKQAGKVLSAEMQYRMAGAREWREPNPESVNWIRAWKEVLE